MCKIKRISSNQILISTIRHGATIFNKEKKIAGSIDVSLSSEGCNQTKKIKERIQKHGYDDVVSSNQKRAIETAILATGLDTKEIIINNLCRERSYGRMEGLLPKELERMKKKVIYVEVGGIFHSLNPPNGESFEAVRKRAEKFFGYLTDNFKGKKVLIFSHQVFLQQLHGLLLGIDPYFSLGLDILTLEMNCFLVAVSRKNRFRLENHFRKRLIKKTHASW